MKENELAMGQENEGLKLFAGLKRLSMAKGMSTQCSCRGLHNLILFHPYHAGRNRHNDLSPFASYIKGL